MRFRILILLLFPVCLFAQRRTTSNSVLTKGEVSSAISAAAPAGINGTGFVKASGATISYDNSTYEPAIAAGSTSQYLKGDKTWATFPTTTAVFTSSTDKNFVSDAQLTVIGNTSGTNSGDNAANSTYASDYRAANFVAGTNYLAPNGNGGSLTGLTASQVGLGNVNNTSDAAKAVSTATQTALDLKANLISPSFTTPALGTPASGNLANCTFPTLNQNTTGSAAKLTTARTINNVSFDGSTNITIPSDIAAGTSGNVLTSNGSLWTSAANTGGYTVVKVTPSDITNSTTSLADITGLITGTLTNAAYYEFEIMIVANSSSTAGGTYAVVLGGSGTGSVVALNVTATTAAATASLQNISASGTATSSVVTLNGDGVVIIRGYIKTLSSGTATVKVQQAKTTSGSLIARVGSYMKYKAM